MEKNTKIALEKKKKQLQTKLGTVETQKKKLTDELKIVDGELEKIRQAEGQEREKQALAEKRKGELKEWITGAIWGKEEYFLGLQVATVLYLKECYLELVRQRMKTTEDFTQSEHGSPHQMQDTAVNIGLCLQIFTKDMMEKEGGFQFDSKEIVRRAQLYKNPHPIWKMVFNWSIWRYELLSEEDAIDVFTEFLAPHNNIVIYARNILNITYEALFSRKVWQ